MNDAQTTVADLKNTLKKFVEAREWQQFHNPKNIAISIAIEAAELLEKFQWVDSSLSAQELEKERVEIEYELADVLAYILSLATFYNIDISTAFERKMQLNAQKYPVEKAKGQSTKYTKY